MSDQSPIQERQALAMRRKSLLARRSILESRAIHWQAMVRGTAALSRDYAGDDPTICKWMVDATVRGAVMEKAIAAELSSINLQIERITLELSLAQPTDWRGERAEWIAQQGTGDTNGN